MPQTFPDIAISITKTSIPDSIIEKGFWYGCNFQEWLTPKATEDFKRNNAGMDIVADNYY